MSFPIEMLVEVELGWRKDFAHVAGESGVAERAVRGGADSFAEEVWAEFGGGHM